MLRCGLAQAPSPRPCRQPCSLQTTGSSAVQAAVAAVGNAAVQARGVRVLPSALGGVKLDDAPKRSISFHLTSDALSATMILCNVSRSSTPQEGQWGSRSADESLMCCRGLRCSCTARACQVGERLGTRCCCRASFAQVRDAVCRQKLSCLPAVLGLRVHMSWWAGTKERGLR